MLDLPINRSPDAQSVHVVHDHLCPNCERHYSCNCHANDQKAVLICRDCEHSGEAPAINDPEGYQDGERINKNVRKLMFMEEIWKF